MSKFTKALERIQEQSEVRVRRKKKTPPTLLVEDAEVDRPSRWLRGVPIAKNTTPEHHIVTYHFANSLVAEQYRMLRVNLKTHVDKDGAQVILVSSAIHSEGKTVTAVNLALSLAESPETRVALIDADLRRGCIGDYLGFGSERPGLSTLLMNTDGLTAKKVMIRNSRENLAVMPRGERMPNPSHLISSTKFRVLIAELRNHFDYIVIDSPPIMSVADPSILAREADGTLMVIKLGRTPKSIISHASMLFKQAGIKVLGYVLTNVEYQSSEYRYDYGYHDEGYHGTDDAKKRKKKGLKQVEGRFEKWEARLNDWWEKHMIKRM